MAPQRKERDLTYSWIPCGVAWLGSLAIPGFFLWIEHKAHLLDLLVVGFAVALALSAFCIRT